MNSPEYVQTSLAAAMTLGMESGLFKEKVKLTGLNLLLFYDKRCIGRCAYCGLSKQNMGTESTPKKKNRTFIRVKWPAYLLDDIIKKTLENPQCFERICVSMVTHPDAAADSIKVIKRIRQYLSQPISILLAPTLIKDKTILQEIKNAGTDMAGIAIDAATEDIFNKYRGEGVKGPHKWGHYWQVLEWAVDIFGKFNAGVHLISGLGETQEEMVHTIYKAHKTGAKTHLFSFYPEASSMLEDVNPPDLLDYRKIQIARYLINEKDAGIGIIKFDEGGNICAFDYDVEEIVNNGLAFMTSGCPGKNKNITACNRPLANERPSETFRNYPYIPEEEEKELIRDQISILIKK
ncbi:MAG: radical SAM protein [Candidatus Humimicrobiaceae bacterium]